MANTRKTKAQLIEELEALRARVKSLEYSKDISNPSSEYLRATAENAPVGIVLHRNGIALYVNPAYVLMFGYDDETELIGGHFTDLVAPRFREELDDRNRRREPGEAMPTSYEAVGLRKDGSEFPFHVQVVHLELPEGAATAGLFTDITERKQAEKAVRQAEERYRDIYENAIEGIFQSTPQGTFLSVNPAMAHIYGYDSPEEMLAKVSDIAHQVHADPQTRAEFTSLLKQKGRVEKFEARNLRKDGSIIWTSTNARAVRDESGAVAYYEGALEDITERKQAEDRLMLLKLSIDAASDGAYWMDTEGRFLYVNETGCKALGYSQDELLQMRIFDVNQRVTPERWAELWKTLRKEGSFSAESVHRRKDGSLFPVEIHSTYLQFGGQEYCNGFAHDITGRRQAQKALQESEELYRRLFENMLNGFAYCKMLFDGEQRPQDFVYLSVNNAFEALTGLKNVVGKKVTEVIPGVRESDAGLLEICGEVALSGKPVMFETYVEALKIWLSVSVYSPEKEYFVSVFDVITERRQAEEALRESEERYRALAETSHDMIFVISEHGVIEYANKFAASQFGLQPEAIIGKNVADMFRGQGGKRQSENIHKVLTTGMPAYIEAPVVFPDGEHWLGTWLTPLKNKTGQATSVMGVARDLTDRVRVEEALRESEERNRIISDLTTDYAFIVDVNSQGGLELRWASNAMARVTGRDIPDVQTMDTWKNVIIPEDQDRFFQFVRQIISTRQPGEIECRSFREGESIHWLQIIAYPKVGKEGSLTIVGAVKDITERKRAEEALRESETIFSSFLEHSPVYVFFKDRDARPLRLSRNYEQMLGMPLDQVLGKTMDELFPSDLAKNMVADDLHVLNEGGLVKVVEELNGRIYETTKFPILKDGKPHMLAGFTLDITDRKQAEEALRESEEKFRHIVESSPMGMHMYRLEPDNRLVFIGANPAADHILGVGNSQFVGKTIEEAFPPLTGTEVPERYCLAAAKGETWHTDQINYQDGRISGAFEVHAFQTSPGHMAAMFLDVTDRKRAEEVLRQYTARLETLHKIDEAILLAETPQAIAEAALGRLRELIPCQRASVSIFDFEHEEVEVLASHVSGTTQVRTGSKMPIKGYGVDEELLHGEVMIIDDLASQLHLSDIRQRLLDEGVHSVINVPLVVQGEPIGALNLGASKPASFTEEHIAIAREVADQLAITIQHARLRERDQRHTEELEQRVTERTVELRAAYEQLQALSRVKDEFVSNVSHELRTPIASVKTYLHLFAGRPEKQARYIETLKREIDRLEHLIEGLLILSRLDQSRVTKTLTAVDLNTLIGEYITDRTLLAELKELALTFEPLVGMPSIIGDRQLIGEVLSILLTNAFNYTSAGGQVIVNTLTREADDSSWAGFSIRDSGWGISPEELPLLFDRFYRGRAARETRVAGTGLGLSIAREIIDLHSGRIEVHSDGIPGHGTTFHVWLPVEE